MGYKPVGPPSAVPQRKMSGTSHVNTPEDAVPNLSYNNALGPEDTGAALWSVRYTKSQNGMFGLLSSQGQLKVFHTTQDNTTVQEAPGNPIAKNGATQASDQLNKKVSFNAVPNRHELPPPTNFLRTRRIKDVQDANPVTLNKDGDSRIVSFDFMDSGHFQHGVRAIVYKANDVIEVKEINPPPPEFLFGSKNFMLLGKVDSKANAAKEVFKIRQELKDGYVRETDPNKLNPEDHLLTFIRPAKTEGTVAEHIMRLRNKHADALDASLGITQALKDSNMGDGENSVALESDDGNWDGSVDGGLSERKFSQLDSRWSFGAAEFFLAADEVLALDIGTIMRKRAVEGYRLDCQKNMEIVADDPGLRDLWNWVLGAEECAQNDGMVSGRLDLSYLGVISVWKRDLGM
jgi:WD repeat-containing protein mio